MRRALCCAALALVGCDKRPGCDDGLVWQDGGCVPYTAAEPEPADGVWRPAPGTSWQWQLTGPLELDVDVQMFDLDLFDTSAEDVAALHARGVEVICYFSAGSYEDWRDDADRYPRSALGKKLVGWEGERWVDVMDPDVRKILTDRLDVAVALGCDGVEPDNVDGYANDNGIGVTATEQLAFNRFLADEAHLRGLSVGLKNDLDQIEALVPWFDWALNEECVAYDECDLLAPFTEGAGRAAFHVEYVDVFGHAETIAPRVCGVGPQLDTLIKTWDLDAPRLDCATWLAP